MRILGRDGSIDGDKVTLKLNQLQADNERYVVVELQAPEGRSEGAADVADVTVTYIDLDKGGSPARAEAKPSVRFSSNAKEVEDGVNKPVMSQVTQQIATEKSEKAVELRDKGDIDGARKVLEENAMYLKQSRDVYASGAAPAPTASIGALSDLETQVARGGQQPRWRRLGAHAQDHALRPAQVEGAAGVLTNDEGTTAVPGFGPAPFGIRLTSFLAPSITD